jgi:hypothetical protein
MAALTPAEATALVKERPDDAVVQLVDLSRRLEFLEIIADGGAITVNGVPWGQMYQRLSSMIAAWVRPEGGRA